MARYIRHPKLENKATSVKFPRFGTGNWVPGAGTSLPIWELKGHHRFI
jgi:hypothetical protein